MDGKKNETIDKLDKIDVSLYHLVFIGNTIENLFKSFNNIIGLVEERDETVIYSGIYSMILIHTNSYLEEFNNFFISDYPEMREVIISIKKAVKPAIAGLKNWKDLNEFRNSVLAHNLRGEGSISVFEEGIDTYDIPKGGGDLHVIFSCIQMINDVLKSAFGEKLRSIQDKFDKMERPIHKNMFSNEEEVKKEIEKIRLEINQNILELKKQVGVAI
jgi:hypothetical protein